MCLFVRARTLLAQGAQGRARDAGDRVEHLPALAYRSQWPPFGPSIRGDNDDEKNCFVWPTRPLLEFCKLKLFLR